MGRNLNYWDSVSTLAGEVANPGKTFPRALLMAVVLVIFMYVAPLMACLGVMPEAVDWKLGFFATVARRVGGPWFAYLMLAAAAVSCSIASLHVYPPLLAYQGPSCTETCSGSAMRLSSHMARECLEMYHWLECMMIGNR